MADALETDDVAPSLQNWLTQGETLYNAALAEFRALEAQLDEVEQKLAAKQAEVNQIAQIINKPPVESAGRVMATYAEVVEDLPARVPPPQQAQPAGSNSSNATIARALTGKFGR